MAEPIVQVRNLTKRFGDFTAVDGVSFDIRQGEILGLLGPNGAGKTTTIQMLLGLITPTAGEIRMFGLPFDRHREEILGRVNFSSTYVSMPQALTVEENLRVVGKLYGMDRITSRIDDIVKRLEMEEFRSKITRKLSSGQMTRLSLAKAFLTAPKVRKALASERRVIWPEESLRVILDRNSSISSRLTMSSIRDVIRSIP